MQPMKYKRFLALCLGLVGVLLLVLFAANRRVTEQASRDSAASRPLESLAHIEEEHVEHSERQGAAVDQAQVIETHPHSRDEVAVLPPSVDIVELAEVRHELNLARQNRKSIDESIERAWAAVNRFAAVEFTARRKAGMYTVIQRHEPDVPLNVKKSPRSFDAYTAEDGEWRLVHLPREEYPELYDLSEFILEIEGEIEAGMNTQR